MTRRLVQAGRATLLAAVLSAVLAACGGSSQATAPPSAGTVVDRAVPSSILRLPLRDQSGRVRHLSDFAGKVVVLSDAMTLCQEHCPFDTAGVVRAAQAVDAAGQSSHVVFLSVTIDPGRDTVPQLAAYRRLYGGPANWLALTASPSTIHRLWSYFGVYTKKVPEPRPPAHNWRTGAVLTYDVEHSDEVFLIDGHGHERLVLEGIPYVPARAQVPARIYRFLTSRGRRNVANHHQAGWTEPDAVRAIGWLLGRTIAP